MPPKWVGLGPEFSKQESLFGRFSLNIDGFAEIGKTPKIVKDGYVSTKIHHKQGMMASFSN